MKRIIVIIIAALCITGCCRGLMPPASTDTRDSVRVEYRETIREVKVEVPVPVEVKVAVVRPDSTSVLYTSLAKSTASLIDGWLHHSLENRQDNKPSVTIPVKDTEHLEYKYKEVIKNVPYPVEIPLTWWQKFRMNVGGWALGGILLFVGGWVLKKFVLK